MGRRFHCVKQCCSNTTTRHQNMLMLPTDLTMDGLVTVMSLFAVLDATRSAGFASGQKRNAGFTMML
ncbi:hypothetical protein GBA52_011648 [Prunus armeniaca]|nr:hypothetical protein GBA52_011648 [Prunus armeniaca]